MTTARTTNRANPSGSSTLSTSSLIDALSDDSDVELIPASSESEISDYEDVSDATSPRTDSEQGNEGEKMNSTSVPSLLSVLCAPELSDLTRKRKTQSNPGKHKKVRTSSSTSSEPKSVKAVDRVRKYPNEQLNVSAGKLFCKACREELSLKSSSLSNHLKSQKNKDGKKRLENKEASERDIAKELAVYSKKTHIVGETIAESTQVFRVKILSTFLRAGVPLEYL